MRTLICGSLAYDNIMLFNGHFKDHILPDQIHILNVCFLVPKLRREFGGCAGNIAYNLKLMGGDPLIIATVGEDFSQYEFHLEHLNIDQTLIGKIEDELTAQAFITTDLGDNQITAFHPGAMQYSHEINLHNVSDTQLGIIAPDGKEGMLEHAHQMSVKNVPFIFDPGQGLPMFSKEELLDFLNLASYLTVNDYEAKLLSDRTGLTFDEMAAQLKALVITLGSQGSEIYADGQRYSIPCVSVDSIGLTLVDPTGCGDAYRAGLLYGINEKWGWQKTGQLASLMGALKIAHRGGQNHKPDRDKIAQAYQSVFNQLLW